MSDMMTAADVEQARKRSVTRQDAIPATAAAPFTILMGPVGLLSGIPGIAQYGQFALPPQGSIGRDRLLSQTPGFETMWAAVIFKLISKKVAQGFRIEDADDSQRRIKAAQQLVLGYDGSYASGLQRGLQDYLLTDMGMVVEKARQSSARGSRIAGLFHLDALRCYPTGDPQKPIVYWSYYGGYHLLDAEDVIRITDMPSPRVEMRGYGFCSASRAWATILKLAAVEVYFREKITGTRNLAIHFVTGVSDRMMRDALNTSEDARDQRGFVLYKGSTIIPILDMSSQPTVVTIPLAEVPDGYNVTEEREDAYKRYAHSTGANVEDFVQSPAGLNTGQAQARLPVITPLPSAQPQAAGGGGAPGATKDYKMKECRACGDHSPANALYCSFCDQPFGVVKDVDTTPALVDSELGAALDWARKARGDE
jgi:hypothetical protein